MKLLKEYLHTKVVTLHIHKYTNIIIIIIIIIILLLIIIIFIILYYDLTKYVSGSHK